MAMRLDNVERLDSGGIQILSKGTCAKDKFKCQLQKTN